MGRNKKYGNITLTDEDRIELKKISKSQTGEYRKVQRAKILLMSANGILNSEIAGTIGGSPKYCGFHYYKIHFGRGRLCPE